MTSSWNRQSTFSMLKNWRIFSSSRWSDFVKRLRKRCANHIYSNYFRTILWGFSRPLSVFSLNFPPNRTNLPWFSCCAGISNCKIKLLLHILLSKKLGNCTSIANVVILFERRKYFFWPSICKYFFWHIKYFSLLVEKFCGKFLSFYKTWFSTIGGT